MSWITELAKVYDNTISWENDDKPTPVYHTTNNAAVTITIDGNGNFIKAERITGKESEQATIMPCERPRTSGVCPYPLCDVFAYIAGFSETDKKYTEKTSEKKRKTFEENAKTGHQMYLSLLGNWAKSKYANKKIVAVYEYVKKETVKHDLNSVGINESDFSEFIRWRVEAPDDLQPCLWKDVELYSCWINYYNSIEFEAFCASNFDRDDLEKHLRKIDLDYATGKSQKIATYHPSKIRNAKSIAKIISANDTDNFTFLGRFSKASEAVQISSDVTQKAHSALRWLLKRQGASVGESLSVVTWNSACSDLPQITSASTDLLPVVSSEIPDKKKESDALVFDFGFDESEDKAEPQGIYQTSKEFADAMKNRLLGYYGDISNPQNIMVMALKEATPGQGRVSIILYRELQNSDMLDALNNWYDRLSWYVTYWEKRKKTPVHTIGTPSPKTIAECAYGERVKTLLVEKTVQRLLPCILDGGVIPADLEIQCVKSASNILVVENYKRDTVLETACAVYKYNHPKEAYELALEENRTSRDYLFGRLLAVEQQYEASALRKAGQDRETNAVRYMQQFSIHPSKTWFMLYKDKLPAYRRHLDPGLVNWFESKIQDITALFDDDEYMNDKPLSGEFLLGYQCQLKAFRKNTDASSDENTED